jgi:hypothetical protein
MTGYTGTGSAPTSGTATSVSYTITQSSTVTFNWYALGWHNVARKAIKEKGKGIAELLDKVTVLSQGLAERLEKEEEAGKAVLQFHDFLMKKIHKHTISSLLLGS